MKDRNVILYPDLNGYDKWSEKAKEIAIIAKSVLVSPTLEGIATDAERAKGLDIADWLLRYPAPSNIESNDLQEPTELSQDHTQGLVTYFLTNTKFLDYQEFTIDGKEIESLPFDVGYQLGVISCPTNERINEAVQFVEDNQNLFDTSLEKRAAFRLGYNYGVTNSDQDKEYPIRILSLIKTQLEK